MDWMRKPSGEHLQSREKNGVRYLTFPALERTGMVRHSFSTRVGGASTGIFSTMNFGYTRGDDPAHVTENYRRMADILGVEMERMVLSWQTHTTNVRVVTEADAGKGIVRERDYRDVDGMITDVPGITLVTFYADCVPLYLLDPVHRAIGLSHSGWRGTVNRMGQVTLAAMAREYGTRPEDVIACIGPSICQDCFEVGEEVVAEFAAEFDARCHAELFYRKENGKYQLDLWRANQLVFLEAGVPEAQIHTTDICTRCNPELLFSHRKAGTERGNLSAFLCLDDPEQEHRKA
ncbi:MAG: peptidoglycan editing factor PgeF [Lachnospiraceae bacterium]|nr:peptidoglycan editing factor PgeF [Lachnospiraceae bacterium]